MQELAQFRGSCRRKKNKREKDDNTKGLGKNTFLRKQSQQDAEDAQRRAAAQTRSGHLVVSVSVVTQLICPFWMEEEKDRGAKLNGGFPLFH